MYLVLLPLLRLLCCSLAKPISDDLSNDLDLIATASQNIESSKDPDKFINLSYDSTFNISDASPDCPKNIIQRDSESERFGRRTTGDIDYTNNESSSRSLSDTIFVAQGGSVEDAIISDRPGSCPTIPKGNIEDIYQLAPSNTKNPDPRLCPPNRRTLCCQLEALPKPSKRSIRKPRHLALRTRGEEFDNLEHNYSDCVTCKFSVLSILIKHQ